MRLPTIVARVLVLAWLALGALLMGAVTGCHWATGIQTCLHDEPCPSLQTCDVSRGVCVPSSDLQPLVPAEGEGEGEPIVVGGEGEGEPAVGDDGEGSGEGEGEPGEGEGEGEGGEGEGEPGEGEGEGEGESGPALPTSVCGNNVVESGEQCDDGDRVSGDGCSSTCHTDRTFIESEPNDFFDTAPVRNATDFVTNGRISPPGQFEDFDAVWLQSNAPKLLRIQTFTASDADDCTNAKAFVLELHDEDVVDAISPASFQRAAAFNSIRNCAVLTVPVQAADYIAVVYEESGTEGIDAYRMQVSVLSDEGAEVEPNDTLATAQFEIAAGVDMSMRGTIGSAEDVDVYAVVVPPGRGVRAEVVPTSSTTQCEGFNTRLALLDDGGLEVATRPAAFDACPFVDGHGASPTDAGARNTSSTARTMFVVVTKGGSGLVGALPYHVAVTVR